MEQDENLEEELDFDPDEPDFSEEPLDEEFADDDRDDDF